MNRLILPLALGLLATSLSACQQDTTAPADAPVVAAATTPEPEPTPAPTPEATVQATDSDLAAKAGAVDMKAFPGTFTGTLPCASCPGIDMRLELLDDGSFKLTETYRGEGGGPSATNGTWTIEDGGKRVLLDPDSKSGEDRSFQILSNDEIRLLGQDGQSADSKLNYSLTRAGG